MIRLLKGMFDALSQGFYLSQVAEKYADPAEMREALSQALGIITNEAPASELVAEKEAELVAA